MNRRLAAGLLLSILLHALVLSLQFGVPGLGPRAPAPLTVTLAAPELGVDPAPAAAAPGPAAGASATAPASQPATGMRLVDPVAPPPPASVAVPPRRGRPAPRRARRAPAPPAPWVIARDNNPDASFRVPQPQGAGPALAADGADAQTSETATRADNDAARHREEIVAEEGAAAEAEALARDAERQNAARLLALDRAAEQAHELERQQLAAQGQALALARQRAAEEAQARLEAQRREADAAQRQAIEQHARALAGRQRAEEEQAKLALQREEQAHQAMLLEQQRQEDLRREREALELAARKQAEDLAQQRLAEQQAARRSAEELARQQAEQIARARAQEAARSAAQQAAEQQRSRAADEARLAAGPGAAGRDAEPGQGAASRPGVPRSMLGSDAANRARALVRGLDILDAPPPAVRPADEPGRARRVVVGAAERDVPLRLYVDSFCQKIERNGSLNGAQRDAGRVRIDPLVSVTIRRDGSVEEVTILRSSGRPQLDDAVRRIVRVNARYAAFPPNVAARYDLVEIRRVWAFAEGLKLLEEVR
jgi:TonB family protein